MPPSLHQTGAKYLWTVTPGKKLRPLPEKLAVLSKETPKLPPIEEGECISEGRKRRLFSLACSLRRYGAIPSEIRRCLGVFNERCEPNLPESDLDSITRSASRYKPQY